MATTSTENTNDTEEPSSLGSLSTALLQARTLQQLAIRVLEVLNDEGSFSETLDQVVKAIQDSTGIEAVGIRLRNGEDFGYFAANGFSEQFVRAENSLLARTRPGDVCRDENGKPRLECTCGLVVSGRTDPSSPLFTPAGSCFLNHGKSSLVFDTDSGDPRINPRGRCFREGYQSLALVPVRRHHEIVGLIQLCDSRPGCFNLRFVEFFEGLSASIGLVLMRKQAEEELRSNNAKLNLAVTSVGMGIWRWEIGNDRRHFDQQTCRLLGIDPETFNGTADEFFAAIHPDDRQTVFKALRQTLDRLGSYEVEYRSRWKDGSDHHIAARGTCVRDSSGQAQYIEGVIWDTSQRHRAQAALQESEQRHRVLFEHSRDALMTLAPPTWLFRNGNAAAVALFGARDAAEFTAHSPWEYSPEKQPDGRHSKELALEMIGVAMQHGAHLFDWTHRRLTGEEFPATVLLTRVELDGVCMLQATVRDESERKFMIARMAQSDRLASMGMLASGIGHEINNPLAYVRFNIESLAEDLPLVAAEVRRLREGGNTTPSNNGSPDILSSASLEDMVARTQESLEGVQRIVSITRALSTFSRVDTGSHTVVDVAAAVESAAHMAHNEVVHRARLVKKLDPIPGVLASEGRLSQVILNLLTNAAQAIEAGDPASNTITIRAGCNGADVFIEVEDTGRGITAENLERVFEPFYTTKRPGGGSGLGLSISRHILSEFGGTVTARSTPGKGSCFTVRLPAWVQESPRSDSSREQTEPADATGRILLIDDEPNIAKSLVRLLGKDYFITATTSGREARELLLAGALFDVVLCDLMMSGMSGIEFHTWLTSYDPLLASQLMFITGGAFTAKAREYLAQVKNETIHKPFEASVLRSQIAAAVRKVRERR